MRIILFLAIFGTLAAVVSYRAASRVVKRLNNRRHIAELEQENVRLDLLAKRQARQSSRSHDYFDDMGRRFR